MSRLLNYRQHLLDREGTLHVTSKCGSHCGLAVPCARSEQYRLYIFDLKRTPGFAPFWEKQSPEALGSLQSEVFPLKGGWEEELLEELSEVLEGLSYSSNLKFL